MNNSCRGCGAKFQTFDPNSEGYIKVENREKSTLCERCFKMSEY